MCDATAAMAVIGSGAGVEAYGAYQGAKAERDQANFAAAVDDNNAAMADAAATDAVLRGGDAANKVRREGMKFAGQQKAALASSGVDVTTGAAAQLQDETQFFTEQDATTVRNNAARQAWGFRQEAQDYRSNAGMQRAVAKSKSPGTSAAVSLLGSAKQVAMMFV